MICELDASPAHSYGYPMIYAYEEEILITYYESPVRRFSPQDHMLKMKLLSRGEV